MNKIAGKIPFSNAVASIAILFVFLKQLDTSILFDIASYGNTQMRRLTPIFVFACLFGCDSAPVAPNATPEFSATDLKETARWANQIIAPLEATREIGNGIVRADTIKSETEKILDRAKPLIGKSVSWGMGCDVYETLAVVSNCTFNRDGGNLTYDMFNLVHEAKYIPVLKVLDDSDSGHYESDPNKGGRGHP